jgi:hypothetical protein
MSPFQIVSALRKEFQSKIDECVTLARNANPDEIDAWDNYLKSLSLNPLSTEERKQRFSLNSAIHTGALPIELRSAIAFHTNAIREKMDFYKNEFGHHDWWSVRVEKPFLAVVEDVQQQTLSEYIGAVRSDSVSTTILQNASEVSHGYFDTTVQSNSKSHQCPTCRAARPADTDLTICSFCGTILFK